MIEIPASATIFNSTMSLILIILSFAVITSSITLIFKVYFKNNDSSAEDDSSNVENSSKINGSIPIKFRLENVDETSNADSKSGQKSPRGGMGKRDRRSIESFCYIPVNSNLKTSNISNISNNFQVQNSSVNHFNPIYYNTLLSRSQPMTDQSQSQPTIFLFV